MDKTRPKQSAIGRLLKLIGEPRHDYRPATDVFLDLNVDRLAMELQLAEEGAERGSQDRPATEAQSLDDFEHRIVERIEAHKQDAQTIFHDHLHTYDERMSALDFEERFTVIRQAAPEAVSEFRAEAALGRDELFALRRRVVGSEKEREHFRKQHRLVRQARVSSTGSVILKVGILAIMFVVEVAINGGFLARSNPLGPLGGALDAVSFAALNILASFLCGLVIVRLLNHRGFFLKFIGVVGVATYLVFAATLNLVLAHLRELPPSAAGDTGQRVMAQLVHAPFVLTDVMSWVFFCIGAIFSLVAMSDGILFTDPYPGYAGVEKRWVEANRKYQDVKQELVDRLRMIRENAIEAMNGASRDLSIRRGELDSILKARARLAQRFVEHQAHISRACNSLLTRYREANRKARNTPAPAYFDKPYELERIIPATDGKEDTTRDQLRASIKESQEVLEAQIAGINAAFEAAATTYREMDELIPEDANAKASS